MTLWGAENEAMRYVVPDQWLSNFSSPRTSHCTQNRCGPVCFVNVFFDY